MSDKPTTAGEQDWTWDQVDALHRKDGIMGIVAAFNVSLAAERGQCERMEKWSATLAKLADDNTVSYNATLDQLRSQLDAAVKTLEAVEPFADAWGENELHDKIKCVLAKIKP